METEFERLYAFADRYKLHCRKDECGEPVLFGHLWKTQPKPERSYGHQIFECGTGRFGLLLMFDTPGKWTIAKKRLLAAGFTIKQDGDTEGTALFDPENNTQARFAIKLARCRVRREVSPERREQLAAALARARAAKAA